MTFWGKRSVRIGTAALTLATLGGGTGIGWYVVRPAMADAKLCDVVKERIDQNGPVVAATGYSASTAILGDSYTAGDGLPERTTGWAYQTGTSIDGVGMTGFTNGGYCGHQTFSERVSAVLAKKPETLIVQGGLNDVDKPAEVQPAAAYLMDQVKSVPRVVVVGPVDAPAREGEAAVDAALRKASESTGREYVSALDWDLPFLADKTHLTPDGHAKFAQLVREALAKPTS